MATMQGGHQRPVGGVVAGWKTREGRACLLRTSDTVLETRRDDVQPEADPCGSEGVKRTAGTCHGNGGLPLGAEARQSGKSGEGEVP
jgi:hypothetical protein